MKHEKLNIFFEDNDSDKTSIKECLATYDKPIYQDKVCFDLGANIGAFTAIALNGGAKNVIAVECEERNFSMLQKSFEGNDRVILIKGAISNQDGLISVMMNKSKRQFLSAKTSEAKPGGQYKPVETEVKAYDLFKLIEKYKPDIIKMDVEGSEFVCFQGEFSIDPCVKEMLMEIHINKKNTIDKLNRLFEQFNVVEKIENVYFNTVNGYNIYFKRD